MTIKKPSKEELEAICKKFGYKTAKVGKYYEVHSTTALRWMKKEGIKTSIQILKEKKPSKEEFEIKCEELEYNATKVGKYYGIDNTTALNWMKKDRVKTNKSTSQISQEKRPSKEELESKCKELGSNTVKVGKYYKTSSSTVWGWMKKEGIKTSIQMLKEKKPPKRELKAKYKEAGRSLIKLGKFYGVCYSIARQWVRNDGIEIRKSTIQISQEKKPSKEELETKSKELGYNSVKVGEFYKISTSVAWKWMKEANIQTRRKPSKEELESKCKELGYNATRVGKFYRVCSGTIGNWMKGYEIKINKQDSIKQTLNEMLNDYIKRKQ